jgi:hypothetical protein
LGKSYLLDEIGEENLYGSVEEALEAARLATQQPVRKSGEPRPQPPSVPAP